MYARPSVLRWSFAFALASLLAGASTAEEPAFRIVGYLPDYRLSTFDPDKTRYVTDLVYFSVEPTAEGDLRRDHLREDDLAKLRTIKAKHGLSLSLCVGGWERSKGFARIAATDETRRAFAQKLLAFCRENQFDGIDLDWEHPADDVERENYSKLICELKKSAQTDNLLVTVAIADWQVLPPAAIEDVDRIHLMAYDAPRKHSTYEYAVSAVERLVKAGVPPGKICLGVPFYGRGIDDRSKTLTYDQIVKKHNPPPGSDEVDGVFFNGPETIRRKTRFAVDKKLGGLMVWELGQDATGERSLLRVIGSEAGGRP